MSARNQGEKVEGLGTRILPSKPCLQQLCLLNVKLWGNILDLNHKHDTPSPPQPLFFSAHLSYAATLTSSLLPSHPSPGSFSSVPDILLHPQLFCIHSSPNNSLCLDVLLLPGKYVAPLHCLSRISSLCSFLSPGNLANKIGWFLNTLRKKKVHTRRVHHPIYPCCRFSLLPFQSPPYSSLRKWCTFLWSPSPKSYPWCSTPCTIIWVWSVLHVEKAVVSMILSISMELLRRGV